MRNGLVKFFSREDIQEALRLDNLEYCYDKLEKLVNANKVSSMVMSEFTSVLLAAGFDPLNYTDKIYGCQYISLPLTDINIPSNIKSIGWSAFYGCKKLKKVIMSNGIVEINEMAFEECTGLTDIAISENVKKIGWNAFFNCQKLKSVTIPDSVTEISSCAFRDCAGLKTVTIGSNVIDIGNMAFYDCTSLTNITIPDNVNSIGTMAFFGCTSLTDVTIPQRFKDEKDLRKSFGDLINKINFTFI